MKSDYLYKTVSKIILYKRVIYPLWKISEFKEPKQIYTIIKLKTTKNRI